TAPPPPPPSFEKQQAAIQANHGQPISMAQTRQIQPARTTAAVAPVKIAPPAVIDSDQLEQKHQQELEQLHQKQDQERQQLEQQQYQAQQKLQQQNAD